MLRKIIKNKHHYQKNVTGSEDTLVHKAERPSFFFQLLHSLSIWADTESSFVCKTTD